MKFTIDWLKEHLDTKLSDQKIIDKLTNVGLEVESFETPKSDFDDFIVAKIINAEKHPNADRLKLCEVDIGKEQTVKVVCGAPNAKKNLITVYAPPGAVIPKSKLKLNISKIRGVTSYGMLCSGSELDLSNDSDGIIELPIKKYSKEIGKNYFVKKGRKVIDISITPNRADCLGVKGIARDLAAAGAGKLKDNKNKKINFLGSQNINVSITKDKKQGCNIFGSCLIKGIKNTESPKWLKDKILSLGQKPISAVVDITNYIMLDLNRPLHAYDADKINNGIIVRNSKKGETFEALDNKKYTLENNMCVISDKLGVLGLGGIIGGSRSGTELTTKNIFLESAYFKPESIRYTSKKLNLDTDAKYRFERGIDPKSIEEGLIKAASLIKKICGGSISRLKITKNENFKSIKIKFPIDLFKNTTGFKVSDKKISTILTDLGFSVRKDKKNLNLIVPSWRPDITQPIDIVEEVVRIKGYDQIKTEIPEKTRSKQTLNQQQKLFHFLQRSVASKGYYETVTWSFADSKINNFFKEEKNDIMIVNPISTDLNVLRSSIFSNLVFYLKKNLDRDIKDISLFEIGPIFRGKKPGQQETVVAAIKSGAVSRLNWIEKERVVDVFDAKRDVMQSLEEIGLDQKQLYINSKTPNYYHPGKAGAIYQDKSSINPIALFGEIHPNIVKKLDIKTEALILFEIFLDRIMQHKTKLREQKKKYEYSDFQKSERDFAFIIDKNFNAQELIKIISEIDISLIKNVKIFDLYEGNNIPENKKSIALSVTIQSFDRSLNDQDLEKINNLIISTVEKKSGAKIRS
tara:strand:- start:967 stop:3375 length:2409 start_codon:yes stop_codon:yes gene_type:complete